jgi:hypothetical protein
MSGALTPIADHARHIVAKLAAHRLFNAAGFDPDCWRAIRSAGVNLDHVTNIAGPIVRRLVSFPPGGGFEADPLGETAFVMAVHDEDAESVIDLVAWSARDPETFGTFSGAAVLGIDSLLNPASYASGPCMLCQTPLSWLKAGCQGAAVILDYEDAADAIRKAPGPLTADSPDYAKNLLASGIIPPRKLVVPAEWRAAA